MHTALHVAVMERTAISADALLALINKELSALESCQGLEAASIEVLPLPDAHGCNWRVASFAGGPSSEPCRTFAVVTVWAFQWRYKVAD